jgi:nicotinate-nucleotide--dimethylbenzimidazole phosphoribosyltransferase
MSPDETPPEAAIRRAIEAIEALGPPDAEARAQAAAILDDLTKPPGSLGRLERLAIELAGITATPRPTFRRRAIVIAAADHGVTRQGVSAYPSAVTGQMVANFLAGGAAINALAAAVEAALTVVDVGVAGDILPVAAVIERPVDLVRARIRDGTDDMTERPALTRDEAARSIGVGLDVARRLHAERIELLGVGEMGIGNTTAASAITAAMTGIDPERVTGHGTGIDEEMRAHKVHVVRRVIELHRPDPADPVGVLAAIGGLEIGALVGLILGAAAVRLPVILDGFITASAALLAVALAPPVRARLIAGHRSVEPGHAVVLERLGLVPLLELDLRLGEGTGAALAMSLVDASVGVRDGMATFSSAAISGPAEPAPR